MTHQLKSLLSGNRELRPMLLKARELQALQQHFMCVAPPSLAQSTQVLSLRLGTLSIAVASATVAAKLRQLAPELAALLRGRGCEISRICVRVQVSQGDGRPRRKPHRLGEEATNALNKLGQSLPRDSALRRSLKKMVQSAG